MNHSWRRRCCLVGTALLVFFGAAVPDSVAAMKGEISEAIAKGKKFLLSQTKTAAPGSLACYALIKAGVAKDHPHVQAVVQEILKKCYNDVYAPGIHYVYEAGVDAMLLEAVDPETYLPQLKLIAAFLIGRQKPCGGWYYASEANGLDVGDTSITQYAILGLWATARAGADVPIETWQKAARWLMLTQRTDGGFGYHPNEGSGGSSTGTMTVAGTGTLLVIRHVLFNEAVMDEAVRPAAALRRFGVLERVPEEREKKVGIKPKGTVTIAMAVIDRSLKEGVRWTAEHMGDPAIFGSHENYYFYGVERMAALLDVERIGNHDWYNEGSDFLVRKQLSTGAWRDSCTEIPATALTLLFLTKATSTVITKPKRTPQVGGGLLIGGRGLPDKLDAVQVNAGEVSKRKIHGPVDGLLAELEKSSDARVEAVQDAVVEAVQLDHPEQLISQVERLKKLADDKRIEVRRTAMWALGRSGNVSVAPYLIRGLSDADESIAREASMGLCILSRRPNGCGLPPEPADFVGDAAEGERAARLERWKKECARQWDDWYLKVRPYDERDDRKLLKRKTQ